MVIFNSYVKLPEGTYAYAPKKANVEPFAETAGLKTMIREVGGPWSGSMIGWWAHGWIGWMWSYFTLWKTKSLQLKMAIEIVDLLWFTQL